MAKPSSRQGLIDYCLRKLGYPVLEINVSDEQIDDLVDDALQYFHERHFDGIERVYLKHQITQEDVDRGKTKVGVGTTSATIDGLTSSFIENTNYISIPDTIIGINNIWKMDTSSVSDGLFNIKYQLFLNDLYYFSSVDLLHYSMIKRYLEDISFILTPDKQIRFNKRSGRLYIDSDWSVMNAGEYLIIDCYRILDPQDFPRVYNDSFLKMYLTALIKKQWGQNLSKFSGVMLPGGVQINGRDIYNDAIQEIADIKQRMLSEYETPPLDMIG